MRSARWIWLTSVGLIASACTMVGAPGGVPARAPAPAPGGGNVPDAVPRAEPASRQGNGPEYRQSGRTYRVRETSAGYREEGLASWYGRDFHGRPTATGERYDMNAMSGAHRTLPLPTYVEVTNLENGRRAVIRLNDRGPFADVGNRIIDVSYAAAVKLGMVNAGTVRVRVRAVGPAQRRPGVP